MEAVREVEGQRGKFRELLIPRVRGRLGGDIKPNAAIWQHLA